MAADRSASTTFACRVWLVPLVLTGTACGEESGRSAELDLVIAELLEPRGLGEEDVRVYGLADPLQPGDEVATHGPEDVEVLTREIDRPTWLLWVDLHPYENFAHETAWAYVDAETGELTAEEHWWFPVVNGEPFWTDDPVFGDPPVPEIEEMGVMNALDDLRDSRTQPAPEPTPLAAPDACRGQRRHAIVIAGFADPYGYMKQGFDLASKTLAEHYEVHEVDGTDQSQYPTPLELERGIENAFAALDTDTRIDELVVYYTGHAWRDGRWILGDENAPERKILYLTTLAEWVKTLPTDEVTFVVEGCFSGKLGDELEATFKDFTKIDYQHIHALTAVDASQRATALPGGGVFTAKLMPQIAAADSSDGKRIPWEELSVAPFRPRGGERQTPQNSVLQTPVLDQYRDEDGGECVVGHVSSQQYDRRINIRGHGFGADEGKVQMQRPDGTWVDLTVDFWTDDAILVYAPMRADGFPHSATSLDGLPLMIDQGHYWLRVRRADGAGETNPPIGMFHLHRNVLQVYEQDWRANFPDMIADPPGYRWVEMWHRLTKEDASVTAGPTIQMARLYHLAEGDPDLATLDNASFPGFELSAGAMASMGAGDWSWDLMPGEFVKASSYLPDADKDALTSNYYGFRMRFRDDYNDGPDWKYLLAYD